MLGERRSLTRPVLHEGDGAERAATRDERRDHHRSGLLTQQHLEVLGVHGACREALPGERFGGNQLRAAGADDEGEAAGRVDGNRVASLHLALERGSRGIAAGRRHVHERILAARLRGLVEQRDAAPIGERLDGELAQRADRREDVERLGEPRAGVREKRSPLAVWPSVRSGCDVVGVVSDAVDMRRPGSARHWTLERLCAA